MHNARRFFLLLSLQNGMNRCFFRIVLKCKSEPLGAGLSLDDLDHDETLEDKDDIDEETEREALSTIAERTTQESQNPSFL